MKHRDAIAVCAVALPAEPPEWVQLLPIGKAVGRDGRAFLVPDRAAADQVVAASQAFAGSMDLVIDYDHQSDLAAVQGVGGTAPAAGWMKELQVRDPSPGEPGGIYARVNWTAPAAERLRAGEYRYLSPVLHHRPDGQVIRLLRAGLTNKPNLDLAALNHLETADVLPTAILAILALAASATEADVIAAINALKAKADAGAGELALCAQAAGLAATATAAEISAAIAAKANPDPAQFVPMAQFTALQAQVTRLTADHTEERATAAVDAAIKAGKVAPAVRDWALDYATKDLTAFNSFVAKQPVLLVPGSDTPSGQPPAGGDGLTAGELAVCAQLGLTSEKFKAAKAA